MATSWIARIFCAWLLCLGAAASAADAPAKGAPAKDAQAKDSFREFVLGNPKAKVTVIEYASLTCPHCAHFQAETYPQIKKNYIDTGKIRFLLRDFPLDSLAMAGAVVARCVSPDKGHKLVELLFANQQAWVSAEKPIEPLLAYAKEAGVSEADANACLQNRDLILSMRDERQRASDTYKIDATPSFFIGDEDMQGDAPYEEISAVIDRQLAKTKTQK